MVEERINTGAGMVPDIPEFGELTIFGECDGDDETLDLDGELDTKSDQMTVSEITTPVLHSRSPPIDNKSENEAKPENTRWATYNTTLFLSERLPLYNGRVLDGETKEKSIANGSGTTNSASLSLRCSENPLQAPSIKLPPWRAGPFAFPP